VTRTPPAASRQPQLLAKLMAVVRPEFRVDVLVPAVSDPIFSAPPCVVAGCNDAGRHRKTGLCTGHLARWRRQGYPDLPTFIATTPPGLFGRARLRACAVPWCQRSRSSRGLCQPHADAWQRAGKPEPERAKWAMTVPVEAEHPPPCRLPTCELWTTTRERLFCRSHTIRWRNWRRRTGGRDVEEFIRHCQTRGVDRVDLRALPPQLKLELQYALQRRADDRRGKMRPRDVQKVVRFVAHSGATSLLDWPMDAWETRFRASVAGAGVRSHSLPRSFLRYAWHRVDDLAGGYGWEAEYPRDVWDLRRLGFDRGPRRLRFDKIPQPWLRAVAKRWIRWLLSSKTGPSHAAARLRGLTAFAKFLAGPTLQVNALGELSREVLERYVAHAASQPRAAHTRSYYIAAVNAFLLAVRQHRWDPTLPADAMIYPEDYPGRPALLPRALDEFVMAQIEQPANLARLTDPTVRLTTLILVNTGLRISDATRLPLDCVVHDGQGAPYLRYYNHKMKREGLVPIDDDLLAEVRAQQERVLARWPQATVLLPARTANPDGHKPFCADTYRQELNRWLATCDVRDRPGGKGKRVHVTPHQFRHTLGTRLINNDVPQEVVRVLLDHASNAMTSHYARLKDETVRRQWERARKVNVRGEEVKIEADSPLADAQWVKHRVGLATQALPNGYCGLPIQKSCPHANACHVCPVFVTTPEFLPKHRAHREQTRRLLETATANGQLRLIEMNRQVLTNLDRIITKLEAGEDPQANLGTAADAG
jgi:integrase